MSKSNTKKAANKKSSSKAKPAASKKLRTKPAHVEAAKVTAPEATSHGATEETSGTNDAVDTRLPAVGTVIEKRDRHGNLRCKCTVEEAGKIRYKHHIFASISAAAMAAATDLGLKNKTQNGYTFWGLSKPPRPAANHVEAATRAWERFSDHVATGIGKELSTEDRTAMASMLRDASNAVQSYLGQVT